MDYGPSERSPLAKQNTQEGTVALEQVVDAVPLGNHILKIACTN